MNNNNDMNNNLNCDIETGVCEAPTAETNNQSANNKIDEVMENKNLQLHYFTDPLCSACYVYDETLAKFIEEQGHQFEYHVHMGGMVPEEKYLLNPAAGLGSLEDLAKHWEDMGRNFNKPINGDLWLTDPMTSSYPPSIAFKAAELQDAEKAQAFMIELRKLLFEESKNIERDENLEIAAERVGLDMEELQRDMKGLGVRNFYDDLEFSQALGVRSFPTLIFIKGDQGVKLTGVRSEANLLSFLQEGLAL